MEGLLVSLEEKAKLLEALLAETQSMAGIIAKGDLEGLKDSVAARQALIGGIDSLDGRIREGSGLSSLSGDERAQKQLARIGDLLRQIRLQDDENVKNAGALAQSFMAGLKETNAEKSLLAYSAAGPAGSKFVNKKG